MVLEIEKRAKREQLRKRKNNLFQRGHETSIICEVDILIVVSKDDKLQTFGSMDNPTALLSEKYKAGKSIISKGPGEFKTTLRMKKAAYKKNATTDLLSSIARPFEDPIKIPESPKLKLYRQRRLIGLGILDFDCVKRGLNECTEGKAASGQDTDLVL